AVVAQGQRDAALVLVVVARRHAVEIALRAEDLGEAQLDVRARAVDGLLARADPVTDTREEIGDGVSHGTRSSPARLDDAGDVAAQGELAEAEPAQLELAQVGAGATAALAAVAGADLELVLLGKPILVRAHCAAPAVAWRKGIPRCASSARPSASVFAVVTTVTFMPLI